MFRLDDPERATEACAAAVDHNVAQLHGASCADEDGPAAPEARQVLEPHICDRGACAAVDCQGTTCVARRREPDECPGRPHCDADQREHAGADLNAARFEPGLALRA